MTITVAPSSRTAARTSVAVLVVVLLGFGGGLLATALARHEIAHPATLTSRTTAPVTPRPPRAVDRPEPSISPLPAVLVAVFVGLAGMALGRFGAQPGPASSARPEPLGRPVPPAREDGRPAASAVNAADLDRLAMTCLQLGDSLSSPALRADIEQALRAAGYELLDPVGLIFDPAQHDAVERRSTADARSHNVIAATCRPGWRGRGRVLRSPEVAVYRFDAGR